MLAEERYAIILKLLDEQQTVSSLELCERFGFSRSTVQRDIMNLARTGKVVRIHGGAARLDKDLSEEDSKILEKQATNKDQKLRIAEYAAKLVESGDYVFIDSGTTTEFMIGFLRERKATYVTNSIVNAKHLAGLGFKVILTGGEFKEQSEVVVGADAIMHIQKYHFTKGFFGTNGVNEKLGFTTPDVREALVKRVAIESTNPEGRYVLADHSKFGQSSAVTFSEIGAAVTITDRFPGESYQIAGNIRIV